MIVFDLKCSNNHVFEAWFASSSDYNSQKMRRLISCPICNDVSIKKAVMAPNVAAKSNSISTIPSRQSRKKLASVDGAAADVPSVSELKEMMAAMAEFQSRVEETHTDVGDQFPEEVRKIHYGEAEHKLIYGEATLKEAAELQEEGIDVLPLPFKGKKSKRLDG
jgi:hypothetical protein